MKVKLIQFSSGRGTSLKQIDTLEIDNIEDFLKIKVEEINKENGITNPDGSDEEEGMSDKCEDRSWYISHGTCDHDMLITEDHKMWDVVDETTLVDYFDVILFD